MIVVQQFKKGFECPDLRMRIITTPGQVPPLPIDCPNTTATVIRGFGNGFFDSLVGVLPHRADFEYLDALFPYPEPQVQKTSYMR